MSNSFQLSTFNNSQKIVGNNDSDKNCFKECMSGIEKYWNDLNLELDKKKKDLVELNRMHTIYGNDEFICLVEFVQEKINEINHKLINMQGIMWDVRTRILFPQNN